MAKAGEHTAALDRADALLEAKDHAAAASLAEGVLAGFDKNVLSRAALIRGKAMLDPLLAQIMAGENEADFPVKEAFREPWTCFMLSRSLSPENNDAKEELEKLNGLIQHCAPAPAGGATGEAAAAAAAAAAPEAGAGGSGGCKHHHHHHGETETENTYVIQELHDAPYDVIVVGAGASGVGVGIMLTKVFELDPERVLLVERGSEVGETFRRWPQEMRFISPSFNQQGWTKSFDLNSVVYGTSPAFTLHAEHPTGEQYATYLSALAKNAELNVKTSTEVKAVRPVANGDGFEVEILPAGGNGFELPKVLKSRYVIWAAGEFQYPRASGPVLFPGAEHCRHNSSVRSWKGLPGDDFVVIGGYESGMDAASNLASCGKRCTVVSSTPYWRVATEDPSTELAPYTAERVHAACTTATPPRLLAPLRVCAVEKAQGNGDGSGGYLVRAKWGAPSTAKNGPYRKPVPSTADAGAGSGEDEPPAEGTEISLHTPQPPVLCAGFEGSVALGVVKDLFAFAGDEDDKKEKEGGEEEDKKESAEEAEGKEEGKKPGSGGCADGAPLLNEVDESTKTPGLFLVGPAVRHGELSFCFVYKFRQRFGVVADAIARGLGMNTKEYVEGCREMNMFLDDFSCCKAACGESC